jgi:predicted kinase
MKIIALSGAPASGKTTIAHALSQQLQIEVCALPSYATPQEKEQAYDELLRQTAERIARGNAVILDSPAHSSRFQGACRELAYVHTIPLYVIYCRFHDTRIQHYRMQARRRGVPDWIVSRLEALQEFEASFGVWDATGLLLGADQALDENIRRALAFVRRYDG